MSNPRPDPSSRANDRVPAGADTPAPLHSRHEHDRSHEGRPASPPGDAATPSDAGPLDSLGRAVSEAITGAAPPEHDRPEELPADALRPGPNPGR
jgi:hypothetical protein